MAEVMIYSERPSWTIWIKPVSRLYWRCLCPKLTKDVANSCRLLSSKTLPEETRDSLVQMWTRACLTGRTVHLDGISSIDDEISVTDVVKRVADKLHEARPINNKEAELPKIIQFPYSRHSSYPELCQLVNIFRPRDVWPCTVHEMDWIKNGEY